MRTKFCKICKKEFTQLTVGNRKTCSFNCSEINRKNNVEMFQKKWIKENKERKYQKQKEWILKNPERDFNNRKRFREKNPNYCKEMYKKNPQKTHIQMVKRIYGLSEKDYSNLIEIQNNKCSICGKDFKNLKRRPAIDHNHKTGKIRGLLCRDCNIGIGCLNDDIELLKKAILYLENPLFDLTITENHNQVN